MNTININTFNSAFKDYPTLSVDEKWNLNEKKIELFQKYYVELMDEADLIFDNRKKIKIYNSSTSFQSKRDTYRYTWNVGLRTFTKFVNSMRETFYKYKSYDYARLYSLDELKKDLRKRYDFLMDLHGFTPKQLEDMEKYHAKEIESVQHIVKAEREANKNITRHYD